LAVLIKNVDAQFGQRDAFDGCWQCLCTWHDSSVIFDAQTFRFVKKF
jgi:hypothetical protein